jgi:YesN/AraC family two-component response regulator
MQRILIIDDDDKLRTTLRSLLENAGYTVDEAEDGAQGLARFRENSADLVITDIVMPEREGLETIMELKREAPKLKIIAMSGGGKFTPNGYLRMAEKLGAVHTIAKPFTKDLVLSAVKEVLQRET